MKAFLDNCLSPRFARMLDALGEDVVALRDKFPANTPDAAWIAVVAAEDRIVITQDDHIRRKPQERAALVSSGAIVFVLSRGFMTLRFLEQASRLISYWAKIEAEAAQAPRGTCFLVTLSGTIERLP